MNSLSATVESKDASAPLLQMRNVSKTFGTLRALNRVELSVFGSEVHSLMGENGAGKSTLMKILSGAYTADPGAEILIKGQPTVIRDPISARHAGIAVIYQELSLSQNLTVAENIYLGREIRNGGRIDRKRMSRECEPVLQRLGGHFSPDTIVSALPIAERQLVEIARAINFDARVIVMDEPTTTLSIHETERLLTLIKQLKTEGLAIIYISHRMAEIYELSDRCSVLRDGSYVGTLERDELNANSLVSMMVGRDLCRFYKKDEDFKAHRGPRVLRVTDLEDNKRLKPSTFDLHAGEVLGVAGLVGSGRTELARAIFGANHRRGGTVELDGKDFSPKSPKESLAAGVAYLTEDRKRDGLFLGLSVSENVNLNVLARDGKFSTVLNRKTAVARARDAIDLLSIRVSHPNIRVGTLSGGNQQKVLLSRLLQTSPRVLILDEPTRGVDISAKEEIYRLINKLAASGVAVLVISSELPEIVGIAHRVLVMREGKIAAEIGGDTGLPITQETIISYATGAADEAPSETLVAEGD